MSLKVITANRLVDGRVVYLDAAGAWSQRFSQARRYDAAAADAALETLSRTPAAAEVVDRYAIEVGGGSGQPAPRGQRETIRTRGPSVRPDLGYQANNG